MPENNLIKTPDLGAVNAIDFVEQFAYSIKNLQQALGITRIHALSQGNKIQTYKFTVTKPTDGEAAKGKVAEGEDIPLTHVSRVKDKDYSVELRKYRKAVTAEEIQRVGYEMAVANTDREVVRSIQKDVRKEFFDFLATAPTDLGKVATLQESFGKVWGKINDVFDDDMDIIVFVNPLDAGSYLGNAVIQNGQSVGFGLTLLSDFTGITVMVNNSVPQGTVYATAKDNLNLAYIDTNGEISKLFVNKTVTTDQTGLIGIVEDDNTVNLTNQSTIFTGVTLFSEVANGVVKATIGATSV